MERIATSIRLTKDAYHCAAKLGERMGLNRTAVIETAIRHLAKSQEVDCTAPAADRSGETKAGYEAG